MSNRVPEAPSIDKCPFCKGRMLPMANGKGTTLRCITCGREPNAVNAAVAALNGKQVAGTAGMVMVRSTPTDTKCPVTGCPGFLAVSGRCACCERREAWLTEHLPVAECEVCHGRLPRVEKNRGRQRRFCDACNEVRKQVPGLGTKLGPRKKS